MDDRDPPIEDQQYLSGLTVVDIGDYRVSRGMTRRPTSSCHHARLAYDSRERRIWCKDCEHVVDPFDAFTGLVEQYDRALKDLERREQRIVEAERFNVRLLATKEIEKAWRSRNMVPSCPHCRNGLFPEDFKAGVSLISRDYALARLGRK